MARKKMRKFSEGGEAARSAKINKRYDRKVADIDSDYKKALAKGKNADVAKAKYEQRMADAADDRAKWTGGDRTQTRAAEKAAEKNLSMTRKYGPRSSDTQVAKAESKLADKAPLSSVDTSALTKAKTPSFKEAFRAAREKGVKTFTWDGKPGVTFTTQLAGQSKAAPKVSRSTPKVERAAPKADAKPEVNPATRLTAPASLSLANKGKNVPTPRPVRERAVDYLESSAAKKRAAEKTNFQDKLFNMLGRGSDADARLAQQYRNQMERDRKYKAAVAAREAQGNKKGGTVKKYKGGGTVMESNRKPIDTRRSVLGSDKDIIARGNRTPYEPIPKTGPDKSKQKPLGRAGKAGFKSGGSVMKKSDKAGRALVKKSADTMGRAMKMNKGGKCYAKGGSIDGIAKKGKTKGKMC